MEKRENTESRSGIFAILITDLEGFTEFTSRISKDAFSEFVRRHEEKVAEIVEGMGGKVVKFLGDGSICIFRSLERAFEAGKMLHREFGRGKPKMKIFLHVGEVVFDDESDIYGFAVNFAFRMIEALKGGAFAVSEPVYHLISEKKFSPSPELWVKGVGESVRIYFYRGDKKLFSETDDVKLFVRRANLWQRFVSFYLDVLIFTSTVGILSGFVMKNLIPGKNEVAKLRSGSDGETVDISKGGGEVQGIRRRETDEEKSDELIEDEKKDIIEFHTPFAEVEAGKEKVKVGLGEGEVKASAGKLEVSLKGERIISISYFHLSGFEIILFTLYLSLFWYFGKGRTPGEWLLQIKVEREDGSPPDIKTSLLRAFLFVIFVLPAGLGIIIPYLISRKFGHDALTKTRVVSSG